MQRTELIPKMRAFQVPGLLSPGECATLIEHAESLGFHEATITTPRGQVMAKGVRNNDRVIYDNPDLAERLWQRVSEFFPSEPQWLMKPVGLNERFRLYRYSPGQHFRPHRDGSFHREGTSERSTTTLMVYLNDDCVGGETRFLAHDVSVTPVTGMGLFFVHPLLHEGAEVTAGRKYVLRTDVMFTWPGAENSR